MTHQEFIKRYAVIAQNYRPSKRTAEKVKDVCLLIIVGASGVGKTTIIDNLKLSYVPSDTTREPRQDEVNGKDMFFRSDYQEILQELTRGEFVQVAVGATGEFYATRAGSYPKSGWATMPVMADVVPIFRALGFKETRTIFVVPPTYDEWMKRMGARKLSSTQLAQRLTEAKRSFQFALNDKDIHFILNDNLNDAVSRVKALLGGAPNVSKEIYAKDLAQSIYKRLARL